MENDQQSYGYWACWHCKNFTEISEDELPPKACVLIVQACLNCKNDNVVLRGKLLAEMLKTVVDKVEMLEGDNHASSH